MRTHILKTDPEPFNAVWHTVKRFEIRKNDRDFRVGDFLFLRETEATGEQMKKGYPLRYTGRELSVRVDYILRGPIYGLQDGWVIMGISG